MGVPSYSRTDEGLPRKIQEIFGKHKVGLVVLKWIQTTDARVKQRRDWFGEFELSVALLIKRDGMLLLIRKSARGGGFWSVPGGFMEKGEEVEAAGVREAKEETGLDVELLRPLRVFKTAIFSSNEGKLDYYLVLYEAKITGGKLHPGDKNEIVEARFVSVGELQELIDTSRFQVTHPSIDTEIIRNLVELAQ